MKQYADKRILKYTVVAVVCDGCRKAVPTDERERGPENWYSFSSYHSEWGNDSNESYDSHDVCSLACYFQVVVARFEYWGGIGDMPTLTVDDKHGPILGDLYKVAQVYLKEGNSGPLLREA